MTISAAMLLLATASQQVIEPITLSEKAEPKEQSSSLPLWRDLRYGMTVEAAAEALRTIDGIDRVEVIVKKGKPSKLKFHQKSEGVDIGAAYAKVALIFSSIGLTEVLLSMDDCTSTSIAKSKLISEALKTKYPSSDRERVVDSDGAILTYNLVYWNEQTRIRMSFQASDPGRYTPLYGAGKFGDLANAIAKNAAIDALNACPTDRGSRIATTLSYTSQAEFQISQAAEKLERERKQEKTAKGL